jgi:hypothetical protein
VEQVRDELVRVLVERAGLDQASAERTADVVVQFAREKGPELARALLAEHGGLGGFLGRG